VDGVNTIPIFTEMARAGEIDCEYTKHKSKKWTQDEIYKSHNGILMELKDPVQKIFGLHDHVIKEASYGQIFSFVDIIVSKLFEGLPIPYEFSIQQLQSVLEYSKWTLTGAIGAD
jgi:hypothetical protein